MFKITGAQLSICALLS